MGVTTECERYRESRIGRDCAGSRAHDARRRPFNNDTLAGNYGDTDLPHCT